MAIHIYISGRTGSFGRPGLAVLFMNGVGAGGLVSITSCDRTALRPCAARIIVPVQDYRKFD